MLFGSTALEVAIGMIFVYLLLSLLCSALNEYIESVLNIRAKNLKRGIELLLNDTKATERSQDLAKQLYEHGLVRPLYRDAGKLPSYIPARTFALALWNMAGGTDTTNLAQIKQTINQLPNVELRQALGTLVDEAEGDFQKARKNIEDWYDSAMDRVSGWYKRRTQISLLVIGIAAAALINADSIIIAKAFIRDPALRTAVVAAAEKEIETPHAGVAPCVPTAEKPCPAPTATPEATQGMQDAAAKVRQLRGEINDLGLPLGWVAAHDDKGQPINQNDLRRAPADVSDWALKLFGLLLSGLAISQGAPFWFDLLNKFMVIRSTVKPKEKSPDEGSKDKRPSGRGGDHDHDDDNDDDDDAKG